MDEVLWSQPRLAEKDVLRGATEGGGGHVIGDLDVHAVIPDYLSLLIAEKKASIRSIRDTLVPVDYYVWHWRNTWNRKDDIWSRFGGQPRTLGGRRWPVAADGSKLRYWGTISLRDSWDITASVWPSADRGSELVVFLPAPSEEYVECSMWDSSVVYICNECDKGEIHDGPAFLADPIRPCIVRGWEYKSPMDAGRPEAIGRRPAFGTKMGGAMCYAQWSTLGSAEVFLGQIGCVNTQRPGRSMYEYECMIADMGVCGLMLSGSGEVRAALGM